jgi:hypothetical protein
LLPLAPAFLLIDPVSDVERTVLQLDPLRFAFGEKCHGVPVHECQVSHIEDQRLPRRFDDEQLPELLDIVRLDPAAESEHYLTVRRSPDSEHNHAGVNCREGQSDAQA